MAVLNPIPSFVVDGPLHAPRAMPAIAGVLLMAIRNSDMQSANRRQRFVPLQPGVDVTQSLAEVAGMEAGVELPLGVGAGWPTTEPLLPKPRRAVHF